MELGLRLKKKTKQGERKKRDRMLLNARMLLKAHRKTRETKFLIRPEKVTLSLEASVTKERQIYVARLQ